MVGLVGSGLTLAREPVAADHGMGAGGTGRTAADLRVRRVVRVAALAADLAVQEDLFAAVGVGVVGAGVILVVVGVAHDVVVDVAVELNTMQRLLSDRKRFAVDDRGWVSVIWWKRPLWIS